MTRTIVSEQISTDPHPDGQQRAATAWNLRHPVGTAVRVWFTAPYPRSVLTATRSVAWVRPVAWTEGGIASIAVADCEGAIPLTRVEAVTDEPALDGAA